MMPFEPGEKAEMLERADQVQLLCKQTSGRSVMECAGAMIDIRLLAGRLARDVKRLLSGGTYDGPGKGAE